MTIDEQSKEKEPVLARALSVEEASLISAGTVRIGPTKHSGDTMQLRKPLRKPLLEAGYGYGHGYGYGSGSGYGYGSGSGYGSGYGYGLHTLLRRYHATA